MPLTTLGKSTIYADDCNFHQVIHSEPTDRVKIEKWPAVTLLKRITRLKIVNSEIRSKDQNSYLERYFLKGSCHRDESSMSHTLVQNCRCEFGCGVHLTCKNTKHLDDMMNIIYILYPHSRRWQ